jgi:hypothetical protein
MFNSSKTGLPNGYVEFFQYYFWVGWYNTQLSLSKHLCQTRPYGAWLDGGAEPSRVNQGAISAAGPEHCLSSCFARPTARSISSGGRRTPR